MGLPESELLSLGRVWGVANDHGRHSYLRP
jgi:hypothetical protein